MDPLEQKLKDRRADYIERSPFPYLNVTDFGNVTDLNAAAQRLFHLQQGDNIRKVLKREGEDFYRKFAEENNSRTDVIRYRGDSYQVLSVKSPSVNGSDSYCVDMLFDNVTQLTNLIDKEPLTGLMSKRYWDEAAPEKASIMARNGLPYSVVMVDLDKFKAINDTYGHPKGDEVLKQVAQILKRRFREGTDIVARYGGEEFSVFVSGGEESANTRINAVRHEVETTTIIPELPFGNVTISAGIASALHVDTETLQDVVNRADQALYLAKKNGRNRIEINGQA